MTHIVSSGTLKLNSQLINHDNSNCDNVDGCCSPCSHEAMSDLTALMGSLVDNKGHIMVPHIYDSVQPLTQEESSSYDPIDFDMVTAC